MSSEERPTLSTLPPELITLITSNLSPADFLSFCRTSSYFYTSYHLSDAYWRSLTTNTFRVPDYPVLLNQNREGGDSTDEGRWYTLYKRLLTQTKPFTWGQDTHGCLGHEVDSSLLAKIKREIVQRSGRRAIGVPREMKCPDDILPHGANNMGVIADLQCGGWSTTLLTSKGLLYAVGVANQNSIRPRRARPIGVAPVIRGHGRMLPRAQPAHMRGRGGMPAAPAPASLPTPTPARHANPPSPSDYKLLRFPAGIPVTTPERYEACTAIRHFSSGRAHVLGLSDDGRIWSWDHFSDPAMRVEFNDTELVYGVSSRGGTDERRGRVSKVVAGWDRSSAYVYGTGILFWQPIPGYTINEQPQTEAADMFSVATTVVPGTSFLRSSANAAEQENEKMGQVRSYAMLEEYLVFVTDLNKVFAVKTNEDVPRVFELVGFEKEGREIRDVQGAYRNFGVFSTDGREVLLGTKDMLRTYWDAYQDPENLPSSSNWDLNASASLIYSPLDITLETTKSLPIYPSTPPALQNASVISLAFGDYHIHALHSNGTVTSYGREPQSCGCLGLGLSGAYDAGASFLRGLRAQGQPHMGGMTSRDLAMLDWVAQETGSQVWFEPEKMQWLASLYSRYIESMKPIMNETANEAERETLRAENDEWKSFYAQRDTNVNVQTIVSAWIEQEGRNWASRSATAPGDVEKTGNGAKDTSHSAYFCLSIAAAGWHSGALVLVDDEAAEKTRRSYLQTIDHKDNAGKKSPFSDSEEEEELDAHDALPPDSSLSSTIKTSLTKFANWYLGIEGSSHTAAAPSEDKGRYEWESKANSPFPNIEMPVGLAQAEEGLGPWTRVQQKNEQKGITGTEPWRNGMPDFSRLFRQ